MIFIDASELSLEGSFVPVEVYQSLWWWDGNSGNGAGASGAKGDFFVQEGTNSPSSSASASGSKLLTINANNPANAKFALEATMLVSSSSAVSANAQLYDVTSSTFVDGSTVYSTSTTSTVVRSGIFTLTPGHVFALAIWTGVTSYNIYLIDASLIIFP